MKKQLKLLSLLVVMIVGTFAFANKMNFLSVDATYVEGPIVQDTVWTLTDSPFVLSKDIIIYPNATLTIEPGVEVRFGGYFSITVDGRLNAVGTQTNNITFTSNKDQPQAGDWGTIKFSGATRSTLAYCVLKYATNGTTIENGNVEIRNSEISSSQNGIYLTGSNQATIQDNTIKANANGIVLAGSSVSGVSITRNIVLSNTQSGINLDANNYANIAILNNILSANNKGFYVSGQVSTQITNNSISYNNVGIFYERANHIARWNDIYGNQMGMDVSSNASVTAEYNYWGHETGPYHATLNPAGKGNPVGGDGKNLDFIFFLTAPIGYINQRPVARLLTDKNSVPPNQIVTFIATTSSDDRRVDRYFFNFGDGKTSGWTTLSIFVHKYSSNGTYSASVTVMDDFGVSSNNAAFAQITVTTALPSLDASLTLSNSRIASERQVSITVYAAIGSSPVSNANIALFAITGGSLEPSSGLTDSTGYFTATFTAPSITQETNIRIIAKASKSGYTDGSDYEYLQVLPLLSVQVTADPDTIKSEETSYVTVHVTHNANPISDVAVRMSSESGSFSPATDYTDFNGDVTFNFTAPQTTTQISTTITATATKSGYFENQGQTKITVNPKVLAVEVTASPATVESEATSHIIVHVTEDAKPVAGAFVTVSSNLGGNFSATTGETDSNGTLAFIFTAPETTTQVDVTLTAAATKNGYVGGEQQAKIVVNPVPGGVLGLPLTTILLILIPVIIIAIVAVLIKMKVIVITHD